MVLRKKSLDVHTSDHLRLLHLQLLGVKEDSHLLKENCEKIENFVGDKEGGTFIIAREMCKTNIDAIKHSAEGLVKLMKDKKKDKLT